MNRVFIIITIIVCFSGCNEETSLDGNWYASSVNEVPIHWVKFEEERFTVMDILGYCENGDYFIKDEELYLEFEDGVVFKSPIELINKDTIILKDSVFLYRVETEYDFADTYNLIDIETSHFLGYNDLPDKLSAIHLIRKDSLQIRLGDKLSNIGAISNYIIEGTKSYRDCILFLGEGISLEDYRSVILELSLLNIRKNLVITKRLKNNRIGYEYVYDNYFFWKEFLENEMSKRNIPAPPFFTDKHSSEKLFIESGGKIINIENIEDYYIWKSSSLRFREYLLKLGRDMKIDDYIYIKDDISRLIFWKNLTVHTMIL